MDDDQVAEAPAEASEQEPEETGPAHCRHCGQPNDEAPNEGDWLCLACERYQSTVQCPTCRQPVNEAMLSADLVPAAHAPARRRKG